LQDSLRDPVALQFRFVGVLERVGCQRRRMMAQRQSVLTLAAQYRDMRDEQRLVQHLDGCSSVAVRLALCKAGPTRCELAMPGFVVSKEVTVHRNSCSVKRGVAIPLSVTIVDA
jgi:hypothetical protein